MRLRSFRLRIALLSAGTSGLVLVGLAISFASVMSRCGLERIDRELQVLGTAQLRTAKPRVHWSRFDSYLTSIYGPGKRDQFLLQVDDADGHVLYRSLRWPMELTLDALGLQGDADLGRFAVLPTLVPGDLLPEEPAPLSPRLDLAPPRWTTARVRGRPWRFVVMDNGLVRLVLGMGLDDFHNDIRRFRRTVLATAPWILFPLAVFGWIVASQAVRPVKTLARVVRGITAKGLDQRVGATDADRELQALIDVINEMLDRLERSFEQATRFGADAAHELNTPLAILQGELQQALHDARPDSAEQHRFADLIEEVQRLKVIVRKLLLFARADAGQMRLARERTNLSDEVGMIVEDLRQGAKGVDVSAVIAPDVFVESDPDLLWQALQNLASNAIKHNRKEGSVAVRLSAEGARAVFRIANTTDADAALDAERLFERFYRADKARGRSKAGVGLGLGLAREIFRAHGGDIRIDSLTTENIAFVATLPLAAPPDPA